MKLNNHGAIKSILLAGGALTAMACNNEKAEQTQATPATSSEAIEHASAAPKKVQEERKAQPYELASTPIPGGWIAGEISPVETKIDPCPFLSDATALAGSKQSTFVLRRNSVSNEKCRWSKNAGMYVSVLIEPLAEAKPNEERFYNLDTPPVLKPQSGPGENAVILYDTAWDKENPYSMSFDQNDKRVNVWISGLKTDESRLRAIADEVAEKMPNAPRVKEQQVETVSGFDACSIWSEESLRAMFAQQESEEIESNLEYSGCRWNINQEFPGEFRLSIDSKENSSLAADFYADKIQTMNLSLANGQSTTGKYFIGETEKRTGNRWSQMSIKIGDKYANMYFTLAVPEQQQATENLLRNFASRVQ